MPKMMQKEADNNAHWCRNVCTKVLLGSRQRYVTQWLEHLFRLLQHLRLGTRPAEGDWLSGKASRPRSYQYMAPVLASPGHSRLRSE